MNFFETLEKIRILPALTLDEPEDAPFLADALVEGGIPFAEITLRTPSALEAIRKISSRTDIFVGAGTVLNLKQAKQSIACGAKFLVSPGFCPEVVKYALKKNIPVIPCAATSAEIMHALSYGLKYLKFFPAEASGGVEFLKAVTGPFPQAKFVCTGGITPDNAGKFLKEKFIAAVGGSWLTPKKVLAEKDWEQIKTIAREAVAMVSEYQ